MYGIIFKSHHIWNLAYIGTIRKKIEPSLAELHEEAMFIPDDALDELKEIGQGMFYNL